MVNGDPVCPICGQYLALHARPCRQEPQGDLTYRPGCICPPTSEQAFQNPFCPRKNPLGSAPATAHAPGLLELMEHETAVFSDEGEQGHE